MAYRTLTRLCIFCVFSVRCIGQSPVSSDHLQFIQSIRLSNITGRVTGMSVDINKRVIYITGSGNNSIEIISLLTGKLLHSIDKINRPNYVCYIPQQDEIFVSTAGTKCYFYSADSFLEKASIRFSASINTGQYDKTANKIYIGFGETELAVVSAVSHKQTGFKLVPGPVDDIQFDKSINRLYLNTPEAYKTIIIDLPTLGTLKAWPADDLLARQIAVDTIQHRLFVSNRKDPVMFIIDGITGRKTSVTLTLKEVNNLEYDHSTHTLYISGNDGVNIFRENIDGFKQIESMQMPPGQRTTLLVPELKLYIITKEGGRGSNAELLLYKIIN